ncbi:MAG: hypothetical protein SNJ58_11785 [Aggregatilineales bacterium]
MTKYIIATCPSCHRRGRFTWLGEQRWPEAVARKLGVPSLTTLWSCPHCATTIGQAALIEPEEYAEELMDELPLLNDDSAPFSYRL